jgi:MFS family permease
MYALSLSGSSQGASIISGFIAQGQGWAWVLYWCAILGGIMFVFLFFFMEETNFVRHNNGRVLEAEGNSDSEIS